ncbi:hypothetical protein PBY51_022907 [Eleginops maclovinus]|uniref:Uncharacterized protein n=1 Tax=Eleginops maclovinus TaxID=56733 RepID=A0AAN7XIS2_ELEMC|nr:hypothetical protein PBY51_022907 [Eleginops maclovinus]
MQHIMFVAAGHHKVTSVPLQHLDISEVSPWRLSVHGHMTPTPHPPYLVTPSTLAFFVELSSLYLHRGGNELMDGKRQHVTHNSTL